MRVWLVDAKGREDLDALEALLNQLAARPESGLALLATRPVWSDFAAEVRSLQPDILVVREETLTEGAWAQEMALQGPAVVIATTPEGAKRFQSVADIYPVSFIPAQPTLECLWLALLSAQGSQRRLSHYNTQIARLQQRLSDRIVIERAKGILVERLGVSEEEAYKRLRVLSRRQRRQIRDIAQSLLDTESLLLPDGNGVLDHAEAEENRSAPHD
jgi:response regulator NasT